MARFVVNDYYPMNDEMLAALVQASGHNESDCVSILQKLHLAGWHLEKSAKFLVPRTSIVEEQKPEDCPSNIIEVRRREDGTLDEVVARNCDIHIEQMNEGTFWMGIYKDNYRQVVNFGAIDKGVIEAQSEMDDWPDAPHNTPVKKDG